MTGRANGAGLSISNFVWMHGEAIDARVIPSLCATWPDEWPIEGQFAIHEEVAPGKHLLARDRLGINKLFFALTDAGDVIAGNFLIDLIRAGHGLERIWSVPSGHCVIIEPASRTYSLRRIASVEFNDRPPSETSLRDAASDVRRELERIFAQLAYTFDDRELYVTLSGGLDSSTVLAFAQRHFRHVTAVTFSWTEKGRVDESEDLRFARRLCEDLDVPLRVVARSSSQILDLVDEALLYGQDWRDFNVHCALVNAALGSALEDVVRAGKSPPLLLTGDTMNEIMADYSPVHYLGKEYYSLPRISPGKLRRFLIGGLDSGDREIGIFHHHGIDTLQPYALAIRAYAGIPGDFLARESAKQQFARLAFGDIVPGYIFDRPKVRAQVGSANEIGGTLALMVDNGYDAAKTRNRFKTLLGTSQENVDRLIRAGYYRFTDHFPDVEDR